ncbi:MAG TPA: prepilin-type N-terminal cleavage/methylation domain-containing protein [Gemmatimonadaceae bacterium]|nr:prepilin-type N-terminal cleavage/methylation domain-containing protein [Gemmatimonadaceae bacterium]
MRNSQVQTPPPPIIPRGRCPTSGFTVVEVMIALVISVVVVAGGRALLGVLGDGAHRLAASAAGIDRTTNAERVLRAVIAQAELASSSEEQFTGSATEARFGSWCIVPQGWLERCSVILTVTVADTVHRLELTTSTGDHVVLRQYEGPLELRYLENPSAGGTWRSAWDHMITPPMGMGVIMGSDTTIFRIGERG